MRIITNKILIEFWQKHADAEEVLKEWIRVLEQAHWRSSQEVIAHFGNTAAGLPGNRMKFDIKGNNYRLVVKIHYNTGMVFIRFIGTHAEYNRIDAEKI